MMNSAGADWKQKMDVKILFQKLSEQGFKVVKNVAYGVVDGYPVVISPSAASTKQLLVNVTLQSKPEKTEMKELRRALKQNGIKAGVIGRIVSWSMKVTKDAEAGELLSPVRIAVQTISGSQIKAPSVCGICGLDGADIFVMHSTGGQQLYDTVHSACMDRMQMDMQSKVDENPGNYLTGLIGAVIGGICGAIPALLVLALLNRVSMWLFALIPIGANFGYRKFNGKMDLGAPIISCLMSLVGLVFLLLGYDVVTNMQYFGVSLGVAMSATFENTFVHFSAEYWEYILPSMGTILLFFVLGLVFSFVWLRRTNKVELKDLQSLKETAQPIRQQETQPSAIDNWG